MAAPGIAPNPSAAPQFMGPVPPNRVEITPDQALEIVLAALKNNPSASLMASLQAFIPAATQILAQYVGAPTGEEEMGAEAGAGEDPLQGGNAASLGGPEEPYGGAEGTEVEDY